MAVNILEIERHSYGEPLYPITPLDTKQHCDNKIHDSAPVVGEDKTLTDACCEEANNPSGDAPQKTAQTKDDVISQDPDVITPPGDQQKEDNGSSSEDSVVIAAEAFEENEAHFERVTAEELGFEVIEKEALLFEMARDAETVNEMLTRTEEQPERPSVLQCAFSACRNYHISFRRIFSVLIVIILIVLYTLYSLCSQLAPLCDSESEQDSCKPIVWYGVPVKFSVESTYDDMSFF